MEVSKLNTIAANGIQEVLKDEWTAVQFYQSASMYMRERNFEFAASYFSNESKEEVEHAEGLQNYLADWNIVADRDYNIPMNYTFSSPQDVLQQAYNLEYDLYGKYNTLAKTLISECPACYQFITKYLTIQDESVIKYNDLLTQTAKLANEFEFRALEKQIFG